MNWDPMENWCLLVIQWNAWRMQKTVETSTSLVKQLGKYIMCLILHKLHN